MQPLETVLRARRVVTPDGTAARWVGVHGERIVAVEPYDTPVPAGARVVDLGVDEVLLPGLVDTHVHINEPGRTEWEGFTSATRAAAAGGVTTLIDMPLNSIPPTLDVEALEVKRACARGAVAVDVGFWGGAVPGNLKELRGLHEAGVFGFKCFLLDSGVEEFPPLLPDELEPVLAEIAALGSLLIVHAEDAEAIDRAPSAAGYRYADFLASRPRGAENLAIAWLVERVRWTGARAHVLHLSSSDALPMLASARRDGVAVTVETCPHYLTLHGRVGPGRRHPVQVLPADPRGGQPRAALAGPRRRSDRHRRVGPLAVDARAQAARHRRLRRRLGWDLVAAAGADGDLVAGPGARPRPRRRRALDASGPAALAGLTRKCRIAVGADADFCVFAPDETCVVDPARLEHRHPLTPYRGRALLGQVRETWLRGEPVDLDVPVASCSLASRWWRAVPGM